MKDILCKRSKTGATLTFIHEVIEKTSAEDIANGCNDYFFNIGPNQAKKINSAGTNCMHYLAGPSQFSLFLKPTDYLGILSNLIIVSSLKNSKSFGHDEISSSLLKQIIC